MAKKCAFCALERPLRGYFGFGDSCFDQLFVLVIDGDHRMARQPRSIDRTCLQASML
jgi:hypothetical protein